MFLLFAFLLPIQVPGSISIDPRLSWYTLETDHFDVHFSSFGQPDRAALALAREVAGVCEEVHATLTPVVGWSPRSRTQVVIADFYDYFNGWAAPFPHNTMTLIPTPPGEPRSNEGDWLRTLILHEYSHILQIDRVAGLPLVLRRCFGRVVMPNALAPAWLNEGYAVYNETRFSQFGRLRSAEYDMMIRAAADANRLLPPDRCGNYELRRFPGGHAPYLYGAWLHGQVAAKGDSNIWERYNQSRSGSLPFLENYHARRILGKTVYALWDETRHSVTQRANEQANRLSPGAFTPTRQLTHDGFWTGSPLWSRHRNCLYYISETYQEWPSIRLLDTATGSNTILHRGLVTGNLSLSPDGRLLAFAELRRERTHYEHTDIFALDLVNGGVRRLTHGLRARDPDFAPDTSLLVFVSNGRGQNNLCLLDLVSGQVTELTKTEDRSAYHGPRFSPGGRWIAVGASRPDGCADIELIDRRTGWTFPVTRDRANDLNPAWSRTGKYLFFVSDRTGVFNLYAYQLGTGQTYQVTNVKYGVFGPSVSLDNRKLALTSFSAEGYDQSVIDLAAADWQPCGSGFESASDSVWERIPIRDRFEDRSPLPQTRTPFGGSGLESTTAWPSAQDTASRLYYYNPFPTILPAFWLPWVSLSPQTELGAFTLAWDALQFHQYQLTAGYRLGSSSPFLTGAYTLRRYRPLLSAAVDCDLKAQTARLNAELPFLATRCSHWLDLGMTVGHDSALNTRADLDWAYSDAHQFRFCVAPVQGRVLGLFADAQSKSLRSDKNLTRTLGYLVQYFGNPPQTWSLRSKLIVGTAFDDDAPDAFILDCEPGLLGVSGYARPSDPARSLLVTGLQLRLPLCWVERGIGTGPLFLQNVNTAIFTDVGLLSSELIPAASDLPSTRVGVGAELRVDVIVSHLLPVSLHAGWGFGLNPLWSYRLYLGISSNLLAGILRNPKSKIQNPINLRHLPEPR